jgi:AcrR family transcriptional regulator
VPSHSPATTRRIPQQQRGERRVATLLKAAAAVIAEVGYEAATMSEIAERAGACVGSLYQFFPNKESLTQALRAQYARDLEDRWAFLSSEGKSLSLTKLIDRLINVTIEFVDAHPAFLKLLDAPSSTHNPLIRRLFRQRFAEYFVNQCPRLSKVEALRLATVTLQIIKALNTVYAEFKPEERPYFVKEFKAVLVCYLQSRIGSSGAVS